MTAAEELIELRQQKSLLLEQVKRLQEQLAKDSHNIVAFFFRPFYATEQWEESRRATCSSRSYS